MSEHRSQPLGMLAAVALRNNLTVRSALPGHLVPVSGPGLFNLTSHPPAIRPAYNYLSSALSGSAGG
jgi:hypothetical protein